MLHDDETYVELDLDADLLARGDLQPDDLPPPRAPRAPPPPPPSRRSAAWPIAAGIVLVGIGSSAATAVVQMGLERSAQHPEPMRAPAVPRAPVDEPDLEPERPPRPPTPPTPPEQPQVEGPPVETRVTTTRVGRTPRRPHTRVGEAAAASVPEAAPTFAEGPSAIPVLDPDVEARLRANPLDAANVALVARAAREGRLGEPRRCAQILRRAQHAVRADALDDLPSVEQRRALDGALAECERRAGGRQ